MPLGIIPTISRRVVRMQNFVLGDHRPKVESRHLFQNINVSTHAYTHIHILAYTHTSPEKILNSESNSFHEVVETVGLISQAIRGPFRGHSRPISETSNEWSNEWTTE